MSTKHAKHPDDVTLGGMVKPRIKAIVVVTCSAYAAKIGKENGVDQLELLWKGVKNIAQECGVLDAEGNVTARYLLPVKMAEESIVAKRNAKREANREKKGKR